MYQVIIIGKGPAGISAALYTTRAAIKTLIIGMDNGSLKKAHLIENYYGLKQPIAGNDLIEAGISQARNLGADIITEEVVSIKHDAKFTVRTNKNEYISDSIIFATGTSHTVPNIRGLKEFEGSGISYCAVCDAFFYKGKDVAILGCCDYALSEAMELLPIVNSVTLISHGTQPSIAFPDKIKIITKEILEFTGKNKLDGIIFSDNTRIDVDGVFVAIGVAGSNQFAQKLGIQTNGSNVVVASNMSTNIPGLYAAGDCTGGMHQIAKAVYEGAKAGTEVIKYLRNKM